MSLLFKTITGKCCSVDVEGLTLGALREKLSKQLNIPVNALEIIGSGRLLNRSNDQTLLSEMKVPRSQQSEDMIPFLEWVKGFATLHVIQKHKPDSISTSNNSLQFEAPKLLWRVRQADKFKNEIGKYPLEEDVASITACYTLEDAFKASEIRQDYNETNHKISIIEAVVVDEKQNLVKSEAGKKYGLAYSFFPENDEKVKVATLGYFKQSSPQFVTLNESPTTEAQKNKEIIDQVNSSIGQLLQASNSSQASIASEENSNNQIIEDFFKSDNPFPEHSLRYKIYEELIDPVSFEIIKDAIILPSGCTFDKESVKTLKECPLTREKKCPLTREPFTENDIKPNPRIQEIIGLLASSSQDKDDNKFKEKLGNLIDGFKYEKTSESRDYRLEKIIEHLEIKNKEDQTPVSNQTPLESSALSSSELTPEDKDKIIKALEAYTAKIKGYNGDYRTKLSSPFFQGSQAVNREANYLLAEQLLKKLRISSNLKLLQDIFSDSKIKEQRDRIITDEKLPEKTTETYYNLGIHSKDLNDAINLARELLTNTSQLKPSEPHGHPKEKTAPA